MPGSGGVFVLFPFVAEDDAFALVADVDQDDVAVDAQDAAVDDLVHVKVGFVLDLGDDGFGRIGHRRLKHGFQRGVTFQTTNEISIYHCTLNRLPHSATNPMLSRTGDRPPRGGRRRSTDKGGDRTVIAPA